jgi:signal transduction histidine kinase
MSLACAARWYVGGFSRRSGIEVRLHAGEIVERLPCEVELALFRVLQEALTKRHANARSVDVEISVRREERYSNGSGRWQGHSGRGA